MHRSMSSIGMHGVIYIVQTIGIQKKVDEEWLVDRWVHAHAAWPCRSIEELKELYIEGSITVVVVRTAYNYKRIRWVYVRPFFIRTVAFFTVHDETDLQKIILMSSSNGVPLSNSYIYPTRYWSIGWLCINWWIRSRSKSAFEDVDIYTRRGQLKKHAMKVWWNWCDVKSTPVMTDTSK